MLRSTKAVLDPSQLLRSLLNIVVKSGEQGFHLFQQQDAREIMFCIFQELCGESPYPQELLTTTLKHQVKKCLQIISVIKLILILPLQATSNMQRGH